MAAIEALGHLFKITEVFLWDLDSADEESLFDEEEMGDPDGEFEEKPPQTAVSTPTFRHSVTSVIKPSLPPAAILPDIPLEYRPPTIHQGIPVVHFTDEEMEKAYALFSNTLVIEFVARTPALRKIRETIHTWGLIEPYSVGHMGGKHVLLRMTSDKDFAVAQSVEPPKVDGCLFRRIKWTPDFTTKAERKARRESDASLARHDAAWRQRNSTATDVNPSTDHILNGSTSVEDSESAQQMDALGLPVSFSTTKKKILRKKKKRKGKHAKSVAADKNRVHGVEVCQLEDITTSSILHDITHLSVCDGTAQGDDEETHLNAVGDPSGDNLLFNEKSISVDANFHGENALPQVNGEVADVLLNNHMDKEFLPSDTDVGRSLDHSSSINGGSLPENVLEDVRSGVQHEGEFFNRQAQNNFFEDSSTSCYPPAATNDDALTLCPSSTDSSLSYPQVDHDVPDYPDGSVCCEFRDWRVVWDSFYKRSYFYNFRSQESTWYPPSCLKNHDMYPCSTSNAIQNFSDEAGVDACIGIACADVQDRDINHLHESTALFQENQIVLEYPRQSSEDISCKVNGSLTVNYGTKHSDEHATAAADECATLYANDHAAETVSQRTVRGLPDNIVKYWHQRYLLFSRFDYGIEMDEEGWFSVTPETIARHHASRFSSGTVIDCFTGVGGNAIQFALKCNHVVAMDIDPQKVKYACHNAAIYGVSDRIDFLIGDFFQIAPRLKGDTVFLSPPWGGPDYDKVQTYDIRSMFKPHGGYYLFNVARIIASKVVMFLPRNVDLNQLAELSLSVSPPWTLEVEKNFLNGKLKAVTAYFERPLN